MAELVSVVLFGSKNTHTQQIKVNQMFIGIKHVQALTFHPNACFLVIVILHIDLILMALTLLMPYCSAQFQAIN